MSEMIVVPPEYIIPGTVLMGYRGSLAHGTWIDPDKPESVDDIDLMGVIIPPLENYFGLQEFGSRGTKEKAEGPWDIVYYEIRKFVGLLTKGNPNVLSLLWLKPEHYLVCDDIGNALIKNRHLFATQAVYPAFEGYAYGQLKRMTHQEYRGYMGEKRKKLVDRFYYDTKNAAHLIRLLRMGIEFLQTGEMIVMRPDARELVEIKTGGWTLARAQREADDLFAQAKEAVRNSPLPKEPDYQAIGNLLVRLLRIKFSLNEMAYAKGTL